LGYVRLVAEADKPRDNRETARIVGLAVTVIVLLALLLDNGQSVRIGYVVGDVRAPLIGVLAITAVLGALVDRLLVWRTGRAKHNG
jgi:uncharacterized integral membrane protein